MLIISLILVGILLRFVPHAPNFTPVAAIALFGGAYLSKRLALIVPIALMVISDLAIGMHDAVFFTWGAFLLVVLIGGWVRRSKSVKNILAASLASSLLFYVVTNFGVWLLGWYPRTMQGLIDCYVLGLPFFRNFTFATIAYCAVFFGVYEFIASRVKNTKLSGVLLGSYK